MTINKATTIADGAEFSWLLFGVVLGSIVGEGVAEGLGEGEIVGDLLGAVGVGDGLGEVTVVGVGDTKGKEESDITQISPNPVATYTSPLVL